MSKTILYINDTYILTFNQLKDLMSNPRLINDDSFRREVLSFYRDGILKKWFEERGKSINITIVSPHDDDIFISLYKYIVGDSECPDIHSDFSKVGELLRCEIDNASYSIINGELEIEPVDKEVTIRFVFNSNKADNNIRSFSLKDNDDCIENVECNWNDKSKGKEFFIEITINPAKYKGKTLVFYEGENNRLCKLFCKYPEFKEFKLGDTSYTFYYAQSINCWIGKVSDSMKYEALDAFIKKHKDCKFKLLTETNIQRLQKEIKIWNIIKDFDFWIYPGDHCNTRKYYNAYLEDYTETYSKNSHLRCWLKLKKIPA